ncbi:MAG: NYN domain-containing protein [Myxococcota bacterium]
MENNLAVLIDFENIAAGTEKEGLGRFDVETLMRHIKDKGRILVARSYADWGRFSRFKQSLLTANVTMMELTSHGMQDKNRADIAMVVDALEMAFTKDYIDTYVVVSGDSDFTPMVLKMRELNKRVIGIGTRKSTSRLLIQACDEFNFYDTVVQPKQRRVRKSSGKGGDAMSKAFDLLEEALDGLQRENPESPLASIVKSAMLRKSPDFAEGDLGFSSFARFLEAARDAKIVRIGRDRKSGGYRVDSADSPEDIDEDEVIQEVKEAWEDPYLPKAAKTHVEALERAGLHPLAAPTRLAVLEALEDVVAARKKRRRKTTIKYVVEDLQKKLRRTHPDLPGEHIKQLLNGLMLAGELIHRDGTSIRTHTAAFTLAKDAQALNQALSRLLLRTLKKAEADLSKTEALAELLYGDSDRRREVEETLAYIEADNTDLDELSLDSLIVAADDDDDDDDDELTDETTDEALFEDLDDLDAALVASEPEAESDPAVNGVGPTASAVDADNTPSEALEPAAKPRKRPARRKTTRTKAPEAAEDLPAEPGDEAISEMAEAPADEEKAPAPKKRRTTRRKKEEPEPAAAEEGTDDGSEEPKKKRVRRRPKKGETEDIDEDAILEVTESGQVNET